MHRLFSSDHFDNESENKIHSYFFNKHRQIQCVFDHYVSILTYQLTDLKIG